MAEHSRILVTGATGNVGRHLVAQLRDMGATVRALARDPDTARLPKGVEVVRGDLTEPESLHAAADRVGSVFLLWPFFAAAGAAEAVDVLTRHARRVVYLSSTVVQDDRDPQDAGVWGHIEHLIRQSGLEWTFLRAGGFAVNTLNWAEQIRTEGVVRWAYGKAARSLIHERDIAAVVARALTEDRHVGARYVLTGPAALTQEEQVRTIGEVIGRPVAWVELTPGMAREQLLAEWGDPGFADGALAYWATLITQPEPVTRTVEEITGAPAHTFREWVHDHIANRYVASFRALDLDAVGRLVSPDVVRVAPMETEGESVELHGMSAIMEHSSRLNADYEIHGVDIDGPFVHHDRFAVRFAFDETHAPSGKRKATAKVSLYTVAGGQITREEVYYYYTPPNAT
jgi:uncharacterized protein YbjT (DUF2867 family)